MCLRVQPEEKVCVITDEATQEIAAAIVANLRTWLPVSRLGFGGSGRAAAEGFAAARLLRDLETSQVSIFAVRAQRNELRSRMQMTDVVNRKKIRHAHMVNINRQIMLEGMRADFRSRPAERQSGCDGAQGAASTGENRGRDGSDCGFES